MNIEIYELSEEDILAVAGGGQIDPPSTQQAYSQDFEIPQIDNNPP